MNLFIELLWKDPRLFAALAVVVIFSVCLHEFMHAYAALRAGDPTAAERGHLTLNPLHQMGLFSLFMLAFLGIAWGQVPVNPARMRGRFAPALVAFAGPAANLVLCIAFAFLSALAAANLSDYRFPAYVLYYGSVINLVLFVLNLIPVPGMDGWHVLTNLFPKLAMPRAEWARGILYALFIILFWGIDYLFKFASAGAGFLRLAFFQLLS